MMRRAMNYMMLREGPRSQTPDEVTIVGGPDIDIGVFSGMHGDYRIVPGSGARMITDVDGSTVAIMHDIERVHFADMGFAFDDAALNSARMIGAAFGAQAMNPALNGVAMGLFDQGLSMRDVAEIAVAHMGIGTNEAFVNQVHMNVVGRAPEMGERDFYTEMLDHMNRADLLVIAANSEANAQQIDLVGIAEDGMPFF